MRAALAVGKCPAEACERRMKISHHGGESMKKLMCALAAVAAGVAVADVTSANIVG